MRLTCLVLLCLIAAPAGATRLEVHSDVTNGEITVKNARYAENSPAPFVADLPAGRYDLWVSVGGRRLGEHLLDMQDGGVHLRGTRWSRTLSSAILPGAGQWRDDGWWSGAVDGGSVALLLGRAVYLNASAGSLREQADALDLTPTDGLIRLNEDLEAVENSRDDYLILTGAFYAGNLLDALTRRGPMDFHKTGPNVVQARYRPAGPAQSMLLSTLWPGLGQVRQGSIGRARVWNFLILGSAIFWGESQNEVEDVKADRDFFVATNSESDPDYYTRLGQLEADVNDREAWARTALYVGAALWAYNIVDAGLVSRRAVADSGEMVRNEGEPSGWTLSPGLVGRSAGVVLGKKF